MTRRILFSTLIAAALLGVPALADAPDSAGCPSGGEWTAVAAASPDDLNGDGIVCLMFKAVGPNHLLGIVMDNHVGGN